MIERIGKIIGRLDRDSFNTEIETFREKVHKAQPRSELELIGETSDDNGIDSAINYKVFAIETDTSIRVWLKISDRRSYITNMAPKDETSPHYEVSTNHFIVDLDHDSSIMNVFKSPPDTGFLIEDEDNEFKWIDVQGSLYTMPLTQSNLISVTEPEEVAAILRVYSSTIGKWMY